MDPIITKVLKKCTPGADTVKCVSETMQTGLRHVLHYNVTRNNVKGVNVALSVRVRKV